MTHHRIHYIAALVGAVALHAGVAYAIEPLASAADFDFAPGDLVGSYVDSNLQSVASEDWRVDPSITIAGTRADTSLDFTDPSWGVCSSVGLSCADADWNQFSVQWDGMIFVEEGTRLAARSDDSSRMWIDIDGDGFFDSTSPEFVNNHWGDTQAQTVGGVSIPLAAGTYAIRAQYAQGTGVNVMQLISVPDPTVRVAYVIPTNRTPQPNGVANLQQMLPAFSEWYCEQMNRNGFARLTPRFEFEADGVTPRIHTVQLTGPENNDDQFWNPLTEEGTKGGGTKFFAVSNAAEAAGVPVGAPGESWFLVPETHRMLKKPRGVKGRVAGGVAGGGSFTRDGIDSGGAIAPGRSMVGSGQLSLANFDRLADERAYDGETEREIGRNPLVEGLSFPSFEGSTFSSLASSYLGAILHERSHALALNHDSRHDANFHGNLMGNGLRGLRGALLPQQFPGDYTRLSYASALGFSASQYFTFCEGPPSVPVAVGEQPELCALLPGDPPGCGATLTTGTPTADGKLEIHFEATDPEGLLMAILRWCDLNPTTGQCGFNSRVDEMKLSGTSAQATFTTPYFTPETANRYTIRIFDVDGGRSRLQFDLVPGAASNRAPRPGFRVDPPQTAVNGLLSFDGASTSDPDPSTPDSVLLFEWEFEKGELTGGTPSDIEFEKMYTTVGARLVRLRVTDPDGALSVSTPIAVRVHRPFCNDARDNDGDGLFDLEDPGCENIDSPFENPQCNDGLDNDRDGAIDWDGGPQGGTPDPECSQQPWANSEEGEGGDASPVATILSPTDGSMFASGALVDFTGSATDPEDGDLTANLIWDSDLDGLIGAGGSFGFMLSDGSHLITASVTDSAGNTSSEVISVAVGGAAPFTLTADGYKQKGKNTVDLSWSGATTPNVDIFRDAALLTTIVDVGTYTDATGTKGSATFVYQVCNEGSTNCSPLVTVNF